MNDEKFIPYYCFLIIFFSALLFSFNKYLDNYIKRKELEIIYQQINCKNDAKNE